VLSRVVYKKQRGRRLLTALATFAVVTGTLAGAAAVLAEPGQGLVFELDASVDLSNGLPPKAAVTDNTTNALPDDWDRVCHRATAGAQCAAAVNDHANARSFDSETTATGTANAQTIFTGGGSKDQQPLSKWAYKDQLGGLPDKDNLLHAMAARYNDIDLVTADQSYVFFGADRYDNSGDAQIGFWFFKTTVCAKADGSFGNTLSTATPPVCSGTAVHSAGEAPHNTSDPTKQGDILVLSDFTQGGTQPTVRVFEYVGSDPDGSDGTLNLIGGGVTQNRDCAVVSTDDFCASVNGLDGAVAPWLFKNKSGETTFGHGEFYEGGLNLNTLGLQNECFASFLAETRSAQSVTATLKDFILGGFEACTATVATTPTNGTTTTDVNSITLGSDIYDHAVITGTGSNQNPTGTMNFYLCSPAQMTALNETTCATGGTAINLFDQDPTKDTSVAVTPIVSTSNSEATSSKATPNAIGTWCWRGEYSGDGRYPAASDSTATECFTVTDTSTISTAQNWVPADSATVHSVGGAALDGKVVFTLYKNGTCSNTVPADVLFTSADKAVSGAAGADVTVTSGATGVTVLASQTYSWLAVFTPSATSTTTGKTSNCETTLLTITN
jgi:hypothetical protein